MRRPQGVLTVTSPGGAVFERDGFQCAHCCQVVLVEPFAAANDMGGMCRSCMGLTCPRCEAKGGCDPVERKVERFHQTQDFMRWFSEAAR